MIEPPTNQDIECMSKTLEMNGHREKIAHYSKNLHYAFVSEASVKISIIYAVLYALINRLVVLL